MKETPGLAARLYRSTVLRGPMPILLVAATLALTAWLSTYVREFQMDVSSDSIILERDSDLRYYDQSREWFGSDDYIVVVLTNPDLFAEDTLKSIGEIAGQLEAIPSVESVLSILEVPLFHSPKVPLLMVASGYRTLAGEADRELARKELTESPLYSNYLISNDGETTAIQVTFRTDEAMNALFRRRQDLRDQAKQAGLSEEQASELDRLEGEYRMRHAAATEARRGDIERIRTILDQYQASHPQLGGVSEGGVPIILADMINYIERDILVFGIGVIGFMFLALLAIFRSVKWVILPTAVCVVTTLLMIGFMSYRGWQTTIVTSNFSSLLLIITMSMVVHIVVRYRELHAGHPENTQQELVFATMRSMVVPCLYMALTTVAGFGSLIVSGIRPVIDFGLLMSTGLGLSFLVCFLFLPAGIMLFPKGQAPPASLARLERSPVLPFARFTDHYRKGATLIAIGVLAFCLAGFPRLSVESRFIDYFRSDTVIYQGMSLIDERLGGTTPLEVVLDGDAKDYWLQLENLDRLARVHRFLDELPETGKVISLETLRQILQGINGDKPVSQGLLNLVRAQLPEDLAENVIKPYATPELDKTRILMRVRESDPTLKRSELRQKIVDYLTSEGYRVGENAHVTGYFVLYNNMLNSLYRSQVLTIGAVILVIWVMFLILFRSLRLASTLIIPNVYPVALVLGTMGWFRVHLDMMTIMIAAITFGMAVDNTIHYAHRFRLEFERDGDYIASMYRCHNSIGRAMLYASGIIVAGFSILVFSEFVPTIYFGIFTGAAMIIALFADLVLTPLLIVTWKPFGPDRSLKAVPIRETDS